MSFEAHLLFGFRPFLTKERRFEAHLLFGFRPFLTKTRRFEGHLLFGFRPFLTKKRRFEGHLLFGFRPFLTKSLGTVQPLPFKVVLFFFLDFGQVCAAVRKRDVFGSWGERF